MRVLVTTTRSWHLERTALAFSARQALAGFWMADRNRLGVPPALYRRCWPYHLAMKPFYHLAAPDIGRNMRPIGSWASGGPGCVLRLRSARCPEFQRRPRPSSASPASSSTTPDKLGALKIVDCPNSHPTTYFGFWQRECDLWCPGERVPIPRWMFARMNREIERADLVLVAVHVLQGIDGVERDPAGKGAGQPVRGRWRGFPKARDPPPSPGSSMSAPSACAKDTNTSSARSASSKSACRRRN